MVHDGASQTGAGGEAKRWVLFAAVSAMLLGQGCAEEESCEWEVTVHAEFWGQDCWGWSVTCDGREVTCKTVAEQPGEGCSMTCDNDNITCQGPALEDYVFRFQAPPGAECKVFVGRGSAVLEEACGVQEVTLVATGSPEEGPRPMMGDCQEQ